MSYADKICKAEDRDEAGRAMREGLSHYGMMMNMQVNATPWDDMPMLVAAMQMTAQALRPMIGECGCEIVDQMMEVTQAVAIDVGTLGKERGEE